RNRRGPSSGRGRQSSPSLNWPSWPASGVPAAGNLEKTYAAHAREYYSRESARLRQPTSRADSQDDSLVSHSPRYSLTIEVLQEWNGKLTRDACQLFEATYIDIR